MHFTTVFVGLSALASLVAAQQQRSGIAITSVPTEITQGQEAVITYEGAEDSSLPVTLVLRQGDPNNLATVTTLTTSAVGGSYTWTPDASLPDGANYAIEVRQGNSNNYSGLINIGGGSSAVSAPASAAASISASAASALSSAISSVSASAASARSSVSSEIASQVSEIVSSVVASVNSSVSAGTSMTMSRNTTMSTATLTRTTVESTATEEATTTRGATRTTTGAGASSTSSQPNSAAGIASPLALVLTAFAAILYLN